MDCWHIERAEKQFSGGQTITWHSIKIYQWWSDGDCGDCGDGKDNSDAFKDENYPDEGFSFGEE